jgi:two-component system, chemotaxis family, chemotaxis protein CheY
MNRGTALVVDDSKSVRLILSRTLGELGWSVEQAPNGRVALNWLDTQPEPASLVLIDWNMPEMDGLELVKNIRQRGHMASSKLMMVTTETEAEQMESALNAGADEYVMKPFTKEVIADKLRLMGLLQ